ncbi:MAG: Uma2 family endonuclease [Planctomycetota bacterium]
MATVSDKLLTIEEYSQLTDLDYPSELVRGKIVRMNPPQSRHGEVCNTAAFLLTSFVKGNDLGRVLTNDSGIPTEHNPDTLRGADVAFYSYSRVPKGPIGDGYIVIAPDIAIEVLSKHDRWPKVLAKVAEYLNVGVRVVCILNPNKSTIQLHRADGAIEILGDTQTLRLPELSDLFAEPISKFFE